MAITQEQALAYFHSDDLIGLGMAANAVRRKLHPEGVVTYSVDGDVDYTNINGSSPDEKSQARLACDAIACALTSVSEMGGSGVLLRQSHVHPQTIEFTTAILEEVSRQFPKIWLHGLSASAVLAISRNSRLSVEHTLQRLRDAGLGSLAGEDAWILSDAIRSGVALGTPLCSAGEWINVHRGAHRLGMRTTAGINFGIGETLEQRLQHLEQIHRLQEETGGFAAFLPASLQPGIAGAAVANSDGPRGNPRDEATAVEHLKMLALSRLYLDNIENMQSSWATQGLKVLQMSLRFGSNDAGSVMPEAELLRAAGATNAATEEDLRRVIRDAGFRPVQRNTLYTTLFLN